MRLDSEIVALLAGETSEFILCGHTHIPRSVVTRSGQLIVNPGSVGLPTYNDAEPLPHVMENYSPHASYAILDCSTANAVVVSIFTLPMTSRKRQRLPV